MNSAYNSWNKVKSNVSLPNSVIDYHDLAYLPNFTLASTI